MIINHNLNAMNAHRNMTANTAASGKAMEKLSSGLRINRAGDDAAGLAISEKMRGQIRGLDQASRNSQDGISMIQTAEGALNETHSILQRMKELSTQAASDTNTKEDRAEIQKEMNQLTSEINRIGNTTEFNTQKLLNGEKGITAGTPTASGTTLAGGSNGTATKAVVTVDIGGGNITTGSKITIGGVDFVAGTDFTVGADQDATGTALAAGITSKSGSLWDATYDSATDKLTLTQKTAATLGSAPTVSTDDATMTVTNSIITTPYAAATPTKATGTVTFGTNPADKGTKIAIGDKTYELYDSTDGAYTGSNVGIDIKDKTNEQIIDAIAAAADPTGLAVTKQDTTTLKIEATTGGVAGNSSAITITAGTPNDGSATLQIGANQDQSFKVTINDMRANALGLSGTAGTTATGATGASFAKIADTDKLTDSSMTGDEYALDVTDNKKASAAIKVIDKAIASVSSERSKLGAYQNRLEHTIANLGTASENLTSAESRVRDVDMAKEMMNFSKNNILSQAAQAMLAQANSQPQGVLQLLR